MPRQDHFQDITVAGNLSLSATTKIIPAFTPDRIANIKNVGGGATFPATASGLQSAIDEAETEGGGLIFIYEDIDLSTTTITVDGSDQVRIEFLPGVVLAYSGTGIAIDIGTNSSVRHFISLINPRLDLDNASSSAIGIRLTRTFNCLIDSPWIDAGTTTASDVGIQMRGGTSGSNFGAYNKVLFPNIIGDWAKGVDIQTGGSSNGVNASQFYGGRIIRGTSKPGTSVVGFHIQRGDTTRIWGTDIGEWDNGLQIASGSNANGPLSVRFENNTVDWVVDSGATVASFWGSTFLTFTDNGLATSYYVISAANVEARLQNLTAVGQSVGDDALRIAAVAGNPAIGFSSSPTTSPDIKLSRKGGPTIELTGGNLRSVGSFGGAAFTSRVTGDTNDRAVLNNGGELLFGSGSAVGDVKLSRSIANTLQLASGDKLHLQNELEVDGDLNHDGTNVGFYGTAPTSQASASAALTGTPGTADGAMATVSGSGADSDINNNFQEVQDKVNAALAALRGVGLIAT